MIPCRALATEAYDANVKVKMSVKEKWNCENAIERPQGWLSGSWRIFESDSILKLYHDHHGVAIKLSRQIVMFS